MVLSWATLVWLFSVVSILFCRVMQFKRKTTLSSQANAYPLKLLGKTLHCLLKCPSRVLETEQKNSEWSSNHPTQVLLNFNIKIMRFWSPYSLSSSHYGHFTPCPRAVTIKFWGPFEVSWRRYHGIFLFVWSQAFECSEKTSMTRLSPKCYFTIILFMGILPHMKLKINQGLWDFEVSWSPGFVLDPLLWGGLDVKHGEPWSIIHFMPCKTPCRFLIPFKFSWSLRSSTSSVKWSETLSTFFNNKRF